MLFMGMILQVFVFSEGDYILLISELCQISDMTLTTSCIYGRLKTNSSRFMPVWRYDLNNIMHLCETKDLL